MRAQNIQFLSIWEVAHRWEGLDPGASGDISVTSKIGERLRGLIWAAANVVNCYDVHGKFVALETLWFGFPKTRIAKRLDEAMHDPGAHRDFLRTVFLHQDEVAKVFEKRERLPAFWFEQSEIEEAERRYLSDAQAPAVQPPKLRADQEDKAKCQQIAHGLWAKHPDMTIADMAKRPEILIEGNGKAYKGKHTLRNWLKEAAPASVRNRRGRPKKQKPPSDPV
jgi:hypothetical protein